MPFFSVIIPTYNRAHLLSKTIDSILAQEFDDLEILVVDDGSTDHTRAILESLIKKDARVKYIYQPNSERGAARNKGFEAATGDYIIFFDSDDIMHPDHLSTLKNAIDQHPGIRFLSTKFHLKENGHSIPLHIDSIPGGWQDGIIYLTGTHTGVMICIRKDNPELKPFEEERRYATLEDWMFLTQNILRDRIYLIDRYTVTVNNHDKRSSRVDNQAIIRKRLLAMDWIKTHVRLSVKETRLLEGHSYRFCAVHAYLDCARKNALRYALKAALKSGIDASLVSQIMKIVIGKKIIGLIKSKSP